MISFSKNTWAAVLNRMQITLLCVCVLLSFACFGEQEESRPTENQIKAAFLFNFAKFIEWPTNSFESRESPFIIAVLGDERFVRVLERTVEGKKVESRGFTIQKVNDAETLGSAHIVFVGKSEKRQYARALRKLQGIPCLTVGDDLEKFGEEGGMINFVSEANKIRFQINNTAAEQAGLKISSKLLRLAVPGK